MLASIANGVEVQIQPGQAIRLCANGFRATNWIAVTTAYIAGELTLIVCLPRKNADWGTEEGHYHHVYLGSDGDLYVGSFGGVQELRIGDLALEQADSLIAIQESREGDT